LGLWYPRGPLDRRESGSIWRQNLGVGGSLDPRRADQAGKGARGIGAAGESENIDFIAALVIRRDRMIGILDDFPQAYADRPAKPMLHEVRIATDPIVIEGLLHGASGSNRSDQRDAGGLIIWIKLGNVGVVALAFLAPGAVDQNDDALHATLTKSVRSAHV
jgi:hypothetical protein